MSEESDGGQTSCVQCGTKLFTPKADSEICHKCEISQLSKTSLNAPPEGQPRPPNQTGEQQAHQASDPTGQQQMPQASTNLAGGPPRQAQPAPNPELHPHPAASCVQCGTKLFTPKAETCHECETSQLSKTSLNAPPAAEGQPRPPSQTGEQQTHQASDPAGQQQMPQASTSLAGELPRQAQPPPNPELHPHPAGRPVVNPSTLAVGGPDAPPIENDQSPSEEDFHDARSQWVDDSLQEVQLYGAFPPTPPPLYPAPYSIIRPQPRGLLSHSPEHWFHLPQYQQRGPPLYPYFGNPRMPGPWHPLQFGSPVMVQPSPHYCIPSISDPSILGPYQPPNVNYWIDPSVPVPQTGHSPGNSQPGHPDSARLSSTQHVNTNVVAGSTSPTSRSDAGTTESVSQAKQQEQEKEGKSPTPGAADHAPVSYGPN